MRRFLLTSGVLGRLSVLRLGLFSFFLLAASAVWGQPANDNFANAFLITGGNGSTNGSNVLATAEVGEPDAFAGFSVRQTVWYSWTAPANGSYTFSTVGSDFDTLIGVYTGTSVSALTLAGSGYDIPSSAFTAPVTLIAQGGTTYSVQVDGYAFGIPQGNIILSWSTNAGPSAAGDFQFTSALYIASESESFGAESGRMNPATTLGARMTITRLKGATGRVLVDYVITNGFYTNIYTTNIYGTNYFSTNGTFFTNIFATNTEVIANYQNNEYGTYVYLPTQYSYRSVTGANVNGSIQLSSTNYSTNVQTAHDCINFQVSGVTTDVPPVFSSTNYFCITTNFTNIVAAAVPGRDYIPTSGTAEFDDFQMSSNILVTVLPSFGQRFPVLNHVVIGMITNVALDPTELQAIPAPTASTSLTNSMLNILSQTAAVVPFQINSESGPPGFGMGAPGTNVFNFERATLRCTENVNGFGAARVYVRRNSVYYGAATSVNYRIDHLQPNDTDNNTFRNPPGGVPGVGQDPGQSTDWEVPLQAGSDYAGVVTVSPSGTYSDNVHLTPVTGTLNWGANDGLDKFIEIPINDDGVVQFNEDFLVQLYLPGPQYPAWDSDRSIGYVRTCNITILFDDQPAGALDRNYNPDNNANTVPPYNAHPGPNGPVYSFALQSDNRAIIGGDFTAYNGIGVVNNEANVYRLARVNVDGSFDKTFNTGDGADAFVGSLALDTNNNVVIGGAFTSFNRVARNHIARVKNDGSLDDSFAPLGSDGTVWAVAMDPSTGNILIAGAFTNVNTFTRHFIARLLPDGSIDPTFDPGVGPDSTIYAIAVQSDGRIVIAGDFLSVDGVSSGHVARLNADGTLDGTFTEPIGFDATIYTAVLQPDGKVVVGGAFKQYNAAYSTPGVARLNSDGSLDPSFNMGTGTDDSVYSLALQPDGAILIGGIFRYYNQTRRVGLARVLSNGMLDTTFMDTAYNQFAGVPTRYYDPNIEPPYFVYALGLQPDGNVLIAGNFPRVGGGTLRDDIRYRHNFARIVGGSTPGPGNISLVYSNYSANQTDDQLFITMTRENGHLGPAAATITPTDFPPGPGAAVSGTDYAFDSVTYGNPVWVTSYPYPTWHLGDGTFSQNNGNSPTIEPGTSIANALNKVYISLINNTNVAGNRQLSLELNNPGDQDNFLLGGERIPLGVGLGLSSATMTIIDPHNLPGVLGFSTANYTVSETTNAIITVTRTNGSAGLVTVNFQTLNGTATNFINYRTNYGRLDFHPGEVVKTFVVTNINDSAKQGDHTVNLRLLNASGGATLGLTNAVLTIVDDDIPGGYVQFSSAIYTTNELAVNAQVLVTRSGSSAGTLSVQIATTNGTAISGTNYIGLTNTLTWNNLDVAPKLVTIPILNDGQVQTNPLTIGLRLYGAILNGTNDTFALTGITNSTIYVTNTDFPGQLSFSTANYSVNENGGPGYITVIRTGGSAGTVTISFSTLPGTSTPGVDFTPTNGTLIFGPGVVSKTFTVPIIDNSQVDAPRFVTLLLSNASPASALGFPSAAVLNIIDDESVNEPPGGIDTALDPTSGVNDAVHSLALQPDGKLLVGGDFTQANGLARRRIARMNTDGSLDQTFSSISPSDGANDSVLTLVCQTDGRILLGGSFTNVDSVRRNYLARIASNGAIDTTFNPGAGPNNPVYAAAEMFVGPDRKVLIGGSFTTFNSSPQGFIARLNNNGSLDSAFMLGAGVDGSVYAIAIQPDGKAVIGGDFNSVGGVTRHHIARLNSDGSVDLSFDPGTGASDSVRAVAVQLDGRILIGGLFTNVNGSTLNHIARLTTRGAVDATFTSGLGANDSVSTIAVQPDTRILLGGQFTLFSGVTRHYLTRLNNDGTIDTMINFGDGPDSYVAAIAIQTNGLINFGGGFTHYDGQPRQHLARIYNGTIGGAGLFEFTSANFTALESDTNAVLRVRRRAGTSGVVSNGIYVPNVSVNFSTTNFTAIAGTNYLPVNTNLVFPPGEVFASVTIPILHDFLITPDLAVSNFLWNPKPAVAGGPNLGNQPSALLTISNIDSGVSFSSPTYFFGEDAGFAVIPIVRTGGAIGATTVGFVTGLGTALPLTNYIPVSNTVFFASGQASNFVQVPLLHYTNAQGNVTVPLLLTNSGGPLLLNPSQATLTIVDVDNSAGQLMFSATNYVVDEASGSLMVTVLRTNGSAGTVQVNFGTVPGVALPNVDYIPTNGVLSFSPGQTSQFFTVPIKQLSQYKGNRGFTLVLSNASLGTTIIGPTNVPATIIDNNVGITFTTPFYVVPETTPNVSISVFRQNGTNGTTTVQYATTNITATAGTNFVGVTNTLTFLPGETTKSFAVQIIHDPRVTGDLSFGVNLFNASAPAQIGNPGFLTVVLQDNEAGINFASTNLAVVTNSDFSLTTNAVYGALKSSGTNLLITVVRSNANTGTVGAICTTLDGTAQQGVDYGTNWASLVFSNGVSFQSFTVQIVTNNLVRGDRTFSVYLTNATPTNIAQLVVPYTATVTITDDTAGLSFSSGIYNVNENGSNALITVSRSNWTNSLVSVDYYTSDGTGKANTNYVPASGTLVFTNGETTKTFLVGVIDNHIVDGGHTVLLNLTNVLGNASLLGPNPATLTIAETDGSLIIPAGVALTGESGPVNGVIDPGETVTLLFGLRNANGTNTVNLTATLVATNGVTSPSGPQNYGVLVAHGPSGSRPFTFTASGTNGQNIQAILQLKDGTTTLSNAVFNFTLGKTPVSYTNGAVITINDLAAATPYPSVINVSNLNGLVVQATATLSNLSHTYPKDIDALLVSPTGIKTYLMAHCGSQLSINNVSLTFDDSTNAMLPYSTQITSGTYHPTSYALTPPAFPAPMAPFPTNATAPPFATNMSVFNGSSPNGGWTLYVYDDSFLNSGTIASGWSLNLTVSGPVPGASDLALGMISIPPTVVASSNVTYTLSVTNFGPAGATNITITDPLPPGTAFVSANPSTGSVTNSSGTVIWNINSMVKDATATLSLVLQANAAGTISNAASVTSISGDPNTEDNTAVALTTVVAPTADLILTMVGSSDPIPTGYNLIYTLSVTNQGPATAPSVSIVDTLPVSVSFVSASAGGSLAGNKVTFANLGNLGSGTKTSVTITVKPNVPGTITNTATASSSVTDPFKADDTASVKTVVEAFQMTVTQSPGSLTFAWPADAPNAYLESATNLHPPTVWTPMTNPPPTLVGGQKMITVPIGSGAKFFRLHGITP